MSVCEYVGVCELPHRSLIASRGGRVVEFDLKLQGKDPSAVRRSPVGGSQSGMAPTGNMPRRGAAGGTQRKRSPVGSSPPDGAQQWISTKRQRVGPPTSAAAYAPGAGSEGGRVTWKSLRGRGGASGPPLPSRTPAYRVGSTPVSALSPRGPRQGQGKPACMYGDKCYRRNPEVTRCCW